MSGWAWLGIVIVVAWTVQIVVEFLLAYRRVGEQERREWERDVSDRLEQLCRQARGTPWRPAEYLIDGKLYGPVEANAVWAAQAAEFRRAREAGQGDPAPGTAVTGAAPTSKDLQ
jgi:hypothetical protein